MLYLEGFFLSAEIEYWCCIAFLHSCLDVTTSIDENDTHSTNNSMSDKELDYIRSLYACCLLNIATCRSNQPNALKNGRFKLKKPVVEVQDGNIDAHAFLKNQLLNLHEVIEMGFIDLCDYSLALKDDRVGLMRKCLIMEKHKL